MSRLSRTRVAVATGLTLGTASAGLLFAPAASAAPAPLPIPVLSPATVVPGQTFTLTLSGCFQNGSSGSPLASSYYQSADPSRIGIANGGEVPADGTITYTDRTPTNAVPGTYTI